MYRFCVKHEVKNSSETPRLLIVEPWAEDFTLLPGEELDVVAYGEFAEPWFEVVEYHGALQVYCNETTTFEVLQGDIRLECGHHRQPDAADE